MKKINTRYIQNAKLNSEKIAALTAYDYPTAKLIDEAGIEMIIVGDSLANVVLGYDDTNKISMNEMLIFTSAVSRAVQRAMIVCDMPFMSYQKSIESAMENIGNAIKSGANAVKIEGSGEYIESVIKRCSEIGIPVVAHIGFTPQSINAIGGHYIQGKTYDATVELLEKAKRLEASGAFAIVLELMPEECAKYITENLSIPTISCGAGHYCDGQVLVSDDVFGKFTGRKPTFARRYGDMQSLITECAKQYISDVKSGDFPSESETFHLEEKELKLLNIH
ncbi:3-methyl-2-oxobutanoate hydroxymethyltransferase [bacterium]|nr:3-methyl-2-oxobutanoate hydroxymethyltransferase [bacterium]